MAKRNGHARTRELAVQACTITKQNDRKSKCKLLQTGQYSKYPWEREELLRAEGMAAVTFKCEHNGEKD